MQLFQKRDVVALCYANIIDFILKSKVDMI